MVQKSQSINHSPNKSLNFPENTTYVLPESPKVKKVNSNISPEPIRISYTDQRPKI